MKTAISEANSSAWLALMISIAGFRFIGLMRRSKQHPYSSRGG
jgi:hypothetical protein